MTNVYHERDALGGLTSRPTLGPVPKGLSHRQQERLLSLESALAFKPKLLLQTYQGNDSIDFLLVSMERLLQYAPILRLLLIAPSPLAAEIKRAYEARVSLVNGQLLSECFPLQNTLTNPLASETSVCISSIREVQLFTRGEKPLHKKTFDAVLLYGNPVLSGLYSDAVLPEMWSHVFNYFTPSYLIGYSETLNEKLMALFDSTLAIALPEALADKATKIG